jgi:hypothetical protein
MPVTPRVWGANRSVAMPAHGLGTTDPNLDLTMLAPSQINPRQIPYITDLQQHAIRQVARETRRAVDPKCPEVQLLVAEMILEQGACWRTKLEQAVVG